MPMRFSTEAANADVMGDDDTETGGPAGSRAQGSGADGTARGASPGPAGRGRKPASAATGPSRQREADAGEAKPGKDINAAGCVKDKDAAEP